jgi:hypothetical protein
MMSLFYLDTKTQHLSEVRKSTEFRDFFVSDKDGKKHYKKYRDLLNKYKNFVELP